MKDFFISYTGKDRTWAEWIAWVLEEAGYSVVIQAWDFRPGGNFVLDMQKATEATRTIAVFSSLYLQKPFPQPEWAAAFAQDPTSVNRKLIPVRVEDCSPPGLLGQIVYVDVFNCDEGTAQERLLAAVKDGRMKPEKRPGFPGKSARVPFPATSEATAQSPQVGQSEQRLPAENGEIDGERSKIDFRGSQGAIVNPATGTTIHQQFGNTTNINTGGGDYAGGNLTK
ncbi:toll/interleukin-1 receptor domain-containing protein [Alkalinema pantanalense CENA528]|uniref:toll/interleukin-1 receptor domain-containing protein n=1 Tax=Alkalinema pantanalense TaxID=1620705 RepID=UPI003D6F40D8